MTTKAFKELPKSCIALVVDNVLVSTSKITSLFYPDSIDDDFDESVINISDTEYRDKVNFGQNVLIGKNVLIGSNCKLVITNYREDVIIGDNCSIGSNNIIEILTLNIM